MSVAVPGVYHYKPHTEKSSGLGGVGQSTLTDARGTRRTSLLTAERTHPVAAREILTIGVPTVIRSW